MDEWVNRNSQGSVRAPCIVIASHSANSKHLSGVVISHQSVVNNASTLARLFRLEPETRTLQFAHFTFDVFALDLFMSLSIGACVILGDTSEMLTDMSSFMISTQTSYAQLTPSVIQLLDPARMSNDGSLRILASSGEPMTEGIIRMWADRLQLFNCYGPTETDVVTAHRMTIETSPHCIGKELVGCKVSIRDDAGAELSRDTIGEICVSGIQVMNKYLNAHDETHWHLGSPEGRIYRTGDLGKMVSSGHVFCYGRKDYQVKVRGNRVNLVEIEEIIRLISDIESTVVLFPSIGPLKSQLCCFLQVNLGECSLHRGEVALVEPYTSEEAISITETVLDELEKSLPTAAVPTSWWVLQDTPLTSSGKVDRQALMQWLESSTQVELQLRTHPAVFTPSPSPSPSPSDSKMETSAVHLAGPEQAISSIWAKLLDMDTAKIPINRSFYAMGAHSLLVVRLVAAIRAHGINFTMQTLRDADTIEKQALLLVDSEMRLDPASRCEADVPYALIDAKANRSQLKEAVSRLCSVPQEVIDNIYPCTPMQGGLMAASLQRPGLYICEMSIRARGRLDRSAFDTAWSQLVALEPILRTRIALIPDFGMLQVVLAPEYCVSSMDNHPCDMDIGSRLWFYVFDESTVRFCIHHSIVDGTQILLMLDKLDNLYEKSIQSNHVPPLPATLDAIRGTPFTHFVHSILRDVPTSLSKEFWLDIMENRCPTDYPMITSTVSKDSTSHSLDCTLQWNYRKLAAECEVPPGALLATLWSLVYSGFADATTVVYGMVHSGRDAAVDGIEDIVAPTIAITPMVAAIDPDMAFNNLAAAHQKLLYDMVPHRHFGLQNIQALGSTYKTACEFRSLLVIQSEIDTPLQERALVLDSVSEARYDYPLVVSMVMRANQTVLVESRFDETIISAEAVRCILSRLEDVRKQLEDFGVQQMVKVLQRPSQTHLERIIASTCAPVALDMRVEDIFHASAVKSPQDPAIFDQELGFSLTYSKVERLSKKLACALVQHGAAPGSIIPLCIGNSAYAILGILAIHEAGCAYVPIDPEHPMKRQNVVIGQVNAGILLCTSRECARYSHFAGQIIKVDEIVPILAEQASGSLDREFGQCDTEGPGAPGITISGDDRVQVRPPGSSVKQSTDTAFVLFTSGKTVEGGSSSDILRI